MSTLVVLEALVLALMAVLVVGLLRSHADILKRLHELGAGLETAPSSRTSSPTSWQASSAVASGRPAHDLAGETPAGDVIALSTTRVTHNTLLAFLSSGCLTCAQFWKVFQDPVNLELPADLRLVVVTKGPDEESLSAIQSLAPKRVSVVMSSDAWTAYEVAGSPYFVLVAGEYGRVAGEGTGQDWPQVLNLLTTSFADSEVESVRHAHRPSRDRDRAEYVDSELLAAGIVPGHPSLYPGISDSTATRGSEE